MTTERIGETILLAVATIFVSFAIYLLILLAGCQPVAEAQNGEPIPARTYTVKDVGEVTVWHDNVSGNDCYFWGRNMFCVQGD